MLRIRVGLGTSMRIGDRRTVKLYHVMNERDATIATLTTEQDAKDWIKRYYEQNPIRRHDNG